MKKILISLLFIVIACGEAEESPNELDEGSNFIPFDGTVFVSNNVLNSSDKSSFISLKKSQTKKELCSIVGLMMIQKIMRKDHG